MAHPGDNVLLAPDEKGATVGWSWTWSISSNPSRWFVTSRGWTWGCTCMMYVFPFTQKKHRPLHTPAKKRQRLQTCFNSFRTLLKQQSQILKFPERFLDFFEVLVLWFGCLSPSYLDFKRIGWTAFFAKEKRGPDLFPRLFFGGLDYPVIWGFDNQWFQ